MSALFIQSESATTSITSSATSATSTVVTTASSGSSGSQTVSAAASIAIARPNHQTKLPNSINIASSLPDHFGAGFESSHFGRGSVTSSLSNQLFIREQTPPIGNSLGTAPSSNNNSHVLGAGTGSTTTSVSGQPNSSATGLGPIARPRSNSSSNTNSSNIPSTNSFGESLLSNLFKNVEEKQNLLLNGPQSTRKLSNPTSSLFSTGNSPSLFRSLTSNRDNVNSLFGAPGYPTTADTVESCLGLAVEDLSLDDIHLEASLERDLGPSTTNTVNNSALGDDSAASVMNCVLGRSPGQPASTLLGSAPVNIPGKMTHFYLTLLLTYYFYIRRQIRTSICYC